jgi:hypothetical protein
MLRAKFGREWWLDSKDFNATNFYGERGGSFPIVVDDISIDKRSSQNADQTRLAAL